MKRESISKKDRFEIFKRDGCRCVYCGKQPPATTLVIEHIHPVSKGGTNSFDNLCTSCVECNQGKGDRLLSAIPPNAFDRLLALQEKLEEIQALKAQSKIAKKIQKQNDEIKQELCNYWCKAFGVETMKKQVLSMMFNRLKWISIETMFELIDSCAHYTGSRSESTQGIYMSGILRKHLAQLGIDYKTEIIKTGDAK